MFGDHRVDNKIDFAFFVQFSERLVGTNFELEDIRQVFQVIDVHGYKGYVGKDSHGFFALLGAKVA